MTKEDQLSLEPSPKKIDEISLHESLELRDEQRAALKEIVKAIEEEGIENIILDAPTGSGKSIIAMHLAKYFRDASSARGYVLTSNLQLQGQYESDIKRFELGPSFASIKGAENYHCEVTNTSAKTGYCVVYGLGKAREDLPCYKGCGYFRNRASAISSSLAVMNYSYWLTQNNYVNEFLGLYFFKRRDFIIFDEAHGIDSTLHNHFRPFFQQDLQKRIDGVSDVFSRYAIEHQKYSIQRDLDLLWTSYDKKETVDTLWKIYREIAPFIESIREFRELFVEKVEEKGITTFKKRVKHLSKEAMRDIEAVNWIFSWHCKLEDYLNWVISDGDLRNVVINRSADGITCDSLATQKYFTLFLHKHCPRIRIFMSATWGGDFDWIARTYSLNPKKTRVVKVDPKWNFDASPIIIAEGAKPMSFANKSSSIGTNLSILSEIVRRHEGQNGVVHTHNYAISRATCESLRREFPQRSILSYSNSKEKELALARFVRDGGILVGPSHWEGVNFPDETSRWQVIMKVPYLSLEDRWTAEKSKRQPTWYSWKTTTNILQALGRSIRHGEDWAVSYIVDSNINSFLHYNIDNFPLDVVMRMRRKFV